MRLALSLAALLLASPALADEHSHEAPELPPQSWSFNGPFGTFDRAALQRGYQVYRDVCASCHSMKQVFFRNLTGIGLSDEQVKALAGAVKVAGGVDDSGQPVERAGLPSDRFPAPFPNDAAARAANGGALPPDLSLMAKAREGGPDYIVSLLTGYPDPPPEQPPAGQYYNTYFPGHMLAMPPPLTPDRVTYADGTPATVEQMARDVTHFLTWAANPEMEARKRMGIKTVLFLSLLTGLVYAVKKKTWKDVH